MPLGKDHVLLLRNLRSSKGTGFGNAKRRAARLQIKHGRYFQCREQGLERAAYTVQALPEFRATGVTVSGVPREVPRLQATLAVVSALLQARAGWGGACE